MAARPPSRVLAATLTAGLLALIGASAGDAPARGSAGPQNNGTPTITGTAAVGETLTGHNGSWFCEPPYRDPDTGAIWAGCKYDFQWQRCGPGGAGGCTNIATGIEQEYDVQPTDAGSSLRVAVTATNYDCNAIGEDCRYSSATALSAFTAAVPGGLPEPPPPPAEDPPTANALPAVAGLPQEGQTLTASTGDWSGARPMGYAYRWSRCSTPCADVPGATEASYALGAADVGSMLRVTVTATNALGSATATSQPTSVVAAVPSVAPLSMSVPTVFGTAKEGETLTADAGSWNASPQPAFTFGWLRCERDSGLCLPILDAAGPNYVLRASDAGRMLRAVVTATNRAGTATATSSPTAVVSPAGVLHLLDGRDSVPASGVEAPDRLRIDRIRFRPAGARGLVGSFHVSDTRGYVVRGALVSVRPARAREISPAGPRATSEAGDVTLRFTVSRAKLARGGKLVLVLRAAKRGDAAVSAAVRVTLQLRS
jgi:hypothetical protein